MILVFSSIAVGRNASSRSARAASAGAAPQVNEQSAESPAAELVPFAFVSPKFVPSGGQVTYEVNAHNFGPDPASGVTVTGQFPAGVTLASIADAAGGSCTGAPGDSSFVCSFDTLAANEVKTISVMATATGAPATRLMATFTIASSTPDTAPEDNTNGAQCSILSTPLPAPAPSPADAGQLAFSSVVNDHDDDVFVQRADGTGLADLTNNPAEEGSYTWSPGGSRLAFLRYDFDNSTVSLAAMDADGSNLTLLTSVPGEYVYSFVWSPDGHRLAFSAGPYSVNAPADIYVINADGTGRASLSGGSGLNVEPAWSPDGARISYVRVEVTPQSTQTRDIYIVNADGTNPVRLDHPQDERDYGAAWSPDGARLAFTRQLSDNTNDLYTVHADGSGLQRLTNDSALRSLALQWSPDGSRIASGYANRADGPLVDVVNADGSGRTALYNPPQDGWNYGAGDVAWSPDSTRLAFAYSAFRLTMGGGQLGNVCVVHADGTGLSCIGDDLDRNQSPDWSPDGARLAFVSLRNGDSRIDVVNADGTGRVELPGAAGNPPKWRPAPPLNTPLGANVTLTLNGVTLTFPSVTTAGTTTVTPIDPSSLTGVPSGYAVNGDSLAFEIHTTAVYTGPITLGFHVPGVNNPVNFGALRVLHDEPPPVPNFVDRTVLAPATPAPSFATRTVYARVTSLSPFLIVERTAGSPAPTTCYSVTQLRLGGFAAAGAFAFTRSGEVLGVAGDHTFLYDGTGMHDLTAPFGPGGSFSFNDPQKVLSEEGSALGQGTDGANPNQQYAALIDAAGVHKLFLPGGTSSYPVDINDAGQAIGTAATATGESHAFRYDHGAMTDLGTLGGTQSFPHAISENGKIAGDAMTAVNLQHAFLYDDAGLHDLGVLPGGTWSIGTVVNGAGQVAGDAEAADGRYHAFLFDGTAMRDLGVLPGDTSSEGLSINAAGQVAGLSIGGPDGVQHIFLYDGSALRDLTPPNTQYTQILRFTDDGVLIFKAFTSFNSDAGDIFVYDGTSLHAVSLGGTTTFSRGPGSFGSPAVATAGGVVAGSSTTAGDTARHAFLYDGTGLHDLNAAVGGFGDAAGINDAGEVVGGENGNAFLYTGGALTNLNDLTCGAGVTFATADGISNAGTILSGGYLLTPTLNPVPPPLQFPPQPPSPTSFPGPPAVASGRIAFESRRDGNSEIYVMNADGTGQTNLTHNLADDHDLAWSPDGSRIAFLRSGGLWVMNADGGNQRQLGASVSRPAWSPDGTKIAVSFQSGTTSGISVINADGSGGAGLTSTVAGRPDSSPNWSPDGTKIVFVSGRDANSEIYVMNADGSNPVNLTNSLGEDYSPSWSPDGSRIVYMHQYQVYVMDADGGNRINVSHSDDPNYGPVWSPDGTRIAYYRIILHGVGNQAAVFVVNPDGSGAQQVNVATSYDTVPAWSPTGAHLAVQNYYPEGNSEIYLFNSDGTGPHNLTNRAGYDANPRWQPIPPPNTPVGTNVTVTQNGVTVTFANVTAAGYTSIVPIAPTSLTGVPAEYVINADSLAFEIHTTAIYSGPITLSFHVTGVSSVVFTAMRVLHDEPPPVPNFVDRTIQAPDSPAPNFATRTLSARASSLGTFLVARYKDKVDPVTTATLSPPPNAAGWNKADVTVTLTASDGPYGSGVQSLTYSATGAQPIAATTVAGNTVSITITTEGATTIHFQATDAAVNVEANRSLAVKLDKTVPVINLNRPATGKTYTVNQSVLAAFNCTDGGVSGIAVCDGTTASGAPFDTAAAGTKTFTVNARDAADNVASQSVAYKVSYGVQALYDETQAYRIGTTIPIKLQIVDVAGVNLSSAGVVVTAVGVTRKSDGTPVPLPGAGSAFTFDPSLTGYVFNLGTTGYAAGTYLLSFSAANDPVVHTVQFRVK
ncbi:MAG TPA: hypothetical protein VGH73_22015 [Thermoanaerobaculia bacterium]|jgi:uncharacterized repeat protein (TIGR01451 family)